VHEDLETFIKAHYLLEVDVFNPSTFQMHLVFGKPMAFLVFDSYLDFKKDGDFIDFLKLKVKQRLHDPYGEKFQFCLVELPNFPELKNYLQPSKLGVHFIIRHYGESIKTWVLDKEFLEDKKTINTNILVEFVSDVLYRRIKPTRFS
jgi:hypothetical protein